MQPLDFTPISNAPLQAMQAAAYGDAMQANRLQNRLAGMAAAEDQRKKTVAGLVAGALYGPQQQGGVTTPQQPVNQLAATPQQAPSGMDPLVAFQRQGDPQAAALMGEMAQVPGGTAPVNQLAPAAPAQAVTPGGMNPVQFPGSPAAAKGGKVGPTAAATDYTEQRVRLRDLYNSGQITAQDAHTYDQQITAAETAQRATRTEPKMAMYKELAGKLVAEGNNEGFQALFKQAQDDPDVKGMIPNIGDITITGKGQTEVTRPFTTQELANVAVSFPTLGINPEVPGLFKMTMKGGKVVGWEPKEPRDPISTEGAYLDGLKAQLAAKNPKWSPKQVEFEAAKQVRAENAAALKDNKKFTFDLKNSGTQPPDSFTAWSKEDKQWWFENKKATGEKPDFGWGKEAGRSRTQFAKEYSQWAQGKGISGAEAGADTQSFKADAGSLKFNTKQLDASSSFVRTIDNNIDQLEKHITTMSKTLNLDRNRILNMGTRDFNKKLVGVANINIYDMLVSAISTENAKLQAGGAGSVAQVSEGARVDMDKIHDKNLPLSEMMKLMAATRQEGGNRIKALKDTGAEIKQRMAGGKEPAAPPHIGQAAKWITSDMHGRWSDAGRQEAVYKNLKRRGYDDAEIGQAFQRAKGL